jgi:hypothetical protein
MTLQDELHDLAEELIGVGWQSTPEIDWTPHELATYRRWAREERLRLSQDNARQTTVRRVTAEEIEHERRTLVGAFVRPVQVTLNLQEAILIEGPDATIILPVKDAPPDPGEPPHV